MNRVITALAVAILSGAALGTGAQDNEACGLVTTAELEGVLGGKVSGLSGNSMSNVQMCTGSSPNASILLRIAGSAGGAGGSKDAAAKGIEMFRKMGAQIDVKIFGPITCSTVIPPRNLESYGFSTTCTLRKNDSVAGIEITAKSRAGMVPIEKLHPLAEKMAGRF